MTSPADQAPDAIRAIAPYQAGKPIDELAREMHLDPASIIKLASNENPCGVPPRARAALEQALAGLARYPDSNGYALKQVISRQWGVDPARIMLGNGSNDIIELVARTFLAPGRSCVFSQYSFAVYALAAQAVGAHGIEVPAREFAHDLDAMLAAIRPDTHVVFITNPNNPTGTCCPPDELLQFIRRVPARVLVVLDEAYSDFMAPQLRPDSIAWLSEFPNLVLARTCSKAYGLAGLRIGIGLMHPEVVGMLNRVRQPFNVNSLALIAAAAALEDETFLAHTVAQNHAGMAQICAALQRMGLRFVPSQGNFVMFQVDAAREVQQALLRQGVIIRSLASYSLPDWLRVSIGLPEENTRFIAALETVLHTR